MDGIGAGALTPLKGVKTARKCRRDAAAFQTADFSQQNFKFLGHVPAWNLEHAICLFQAADFCQQLFMQFFMPGTALFQATNFCQHLAAKYVAEYVAEHASPDPDVPLLTSNIIRAAIMKATGVNTAGTFITNVKKLALDLISGTVAAGYQKLHTYMVQLAEDNGGTYGVFETNESNEFTRCFFMPGCFKNSVRCVKPVIAFDGCHLKGLFSKSGVYLTASIKDGSHCNLLAAIAIVPQEGELNWTWFLKHMKSSSMGFDENATLFASDRDKGM
ncbi:hypothetical protein DYB28_003292 [Aphanomyces astaci]|uniref:MULE transposase domain-containing protein n=1 Tax=Aphanomyces astaci TaxID=112090 RepID=A0A9X8HDU1_APHAT|nr:hypothetical protein DYB28_003292 [Aphanomyces astaci]